MNRSRSCSGGSSNPREHLRYLTKLCQNIPPKETECHLAVFELKIGRRGGSCGQEGGLPGETAEVAAVGLVDGEVARGAVVPLPVEGAHGGARILQIFTLLYINFPYNKSQFYSNLVNIAAGHDAVDIFVPAASRQVGGGDVRGAACHCRRCES